jgi:glycolate oxidase subunit GlcD
MSTVVIQPGALLAEAPADLSIDAVNRELAAYRLCLPIAPLLPERSLRDLVATNAGGRRRLLHGTVVRYLRGAVFTDFAVGGPTLKRATGYGLQRTLIGGALLDLAQLQRLTFNVRPLPAARQPSLWRCESPAALVRFAQKLRGSGLALAALACAYDDDGLLLLVELEGAAAVVTRQQHSVGEHAAGAVQLPAAQPWQLWEELAWKRQQAAAIDLTLPQRQIARFWQDARRIAARYRIAIHCWGDLGVGALTLHCDTASHAGEAAQALILCAEAARSYGGSVNSEFGASEGDARGKLWIVRAFGHARPVSTAILLAELAAVVGTDYLITRPEDLSTYAQDASIAQPTGLPLAVALPADSQQVAALVRLAAAHELSVVTRGAGSGLAGGALPSPGALMIGLARLNSLHIDREQMTARVGAGVTTSDLQAAAEGLGLFYPPDPSSQTVSTIGGNIACNAGGPRCLKYGVTADYVLALQAVLADGRLVELGDGLCGQSADAGLVQLLVGSEGTLALITEATLRLIPRPLARRTVLALFADLADACGTVEQVMASGIIPAGLELMDDTTIAAVEQYLQLGLSPETGAMLLLLADGEPEAVDVEVERLAALAHAGGAFSVQIAQNAAEEGQLWQARRSVSIALARILPNRLGEDVCVPVDRIAAFVARVKEIAAATGRPIVVFGHAGDGNLHPNILFDSRDPGQVAATWRAAEAIFALALELGGTLSGEHGIGTLKRTFMAQAFSPAALAQQRAIKQACDPAGLLNPGKVLP